MNFLPPAANKDLGSYVDCTLQSKIVNGVGALSVVLLVLTIGFLIYVVWHKMLQDEKTKRISRFLFGFWTLIPPCLFWLEYHMLWRPYNDPASPNYSAMYERFTYSQESSAKVWLAVVTILAGFCWSEIASTKGGEGS